MREDAPRPTFVSKTKIDENWARTFGKRQPPPEYACPHGLGLECKQCHLARRRQKADVAAIHADKRTR